MNICVLYGGESAEREISLKSGRAVLEALSSLCHFVILLDATQENLKKLTSEDIDLVFIVLHGQSGENGDVQKLLKDKGILYTGTGVESSRICGDKLLSKRLFKQAGVASPPYQVIDVSERDLLQWNNYPCVVKPREEGSSIGVSLVTEESALAKAMNEAFRYSSKILIEEYIEGREMTVGVLGDQALPCIEILTERPFFDYEAKYSKGMTRYICRPELTVEEEKVIASLILQLKDIVPCRDFYRVDFILAGGIPYLLELNTIPGFTETSSVPMAAAEIGISFPDLCDKIVKMTWNRRKKVANKEYYG